MRIYSSNHINEATLTASSSDINQDLERVKIAHLAQTFRFDGNDEWIKINLGESMDIKSFIVDRGNLTSTATVTLQANTTDSWTAPEYSQVLTETDSMYYTDLDETYQWWRLVIEDSSIVKISIGYIVIGDEYIQMPGIDPEVDLQYNTTSQRSISVSGQVFGNRGYRYLETTFSFPQFDNETRKKLLAMWEDIENLTPVWVMLWANNLNDFEPIFAVIEDNSISFKKVEWGSYYSCDITVRQVF